MAGTVTVEPIKGIMVGSFGQEIVLTVINEDGAAQDVSGYGTITVAGLSPDQTKPITATGSYATGNNGTDGKVKFKWASGDIDRKGTWQVQVEFLDGTTELFKTYPTTMEVGQGLRS